MLLKSKAALFFILYVFLLFGAFVGAWLGIIGGKWPTGETLSSVADAEWRNFVSIATLGVTAVSAFMAALLSILNLSSQARIARELERVKIVHEKSIPAHGDLYSAATNYYRVLAQLEKGFFSHDAAGNAETKMEEFEGRIVYVGEDFAEAWRDFWQNARYIKEGVGVAIESSESRKEYWRRDGKDLGKKLNNLEGLARKKFS